MIKQFISILLAACLALGVALLPITPAHADRLEPIDSLLTIEDFPAGFVQVPASAVEGCVPQGEEGTVAAFVQQENETGSEAVCVSTFLLTARAANDSQAALMRQMMDTILDHPQALIDSGTTAETATIELLNSLPVLGDKAIGLTKHDPTQWHEILLFRRGDYLSSITIHYPAGASPEVPITSLATQLDRRMMQWVDQDGH